MAILKINQIKRLEKKERRNKLSELRKELMKLRAQVATGTSVENPGRIREIRRTIARIKMIEDQNKHKEVQ